MAASYFNHPQLFYRERNSEAGHDVKTQTQDNKFDYILGGKLSTTDVIFKIVQKNWATDPSIMNRTLSENPTQFKDYLVVIRSPDKKQKTRHVSTPSTFVELTDGSSQTYANNYDRYPNSVQMFPSPWLTTPQPKKDLNINPQWRI